MRSNNLTSVLVIEDNPGDARLLREMFKEVGLPAISVTHVESMAEAEAHLAHQPVDVILLDLGLPDAQGVGAVRRARAVAPRVPLVVVTGLDDEELASRALQEGAQDYLIKGQIETRALLRAVRYAIERTTMEEQLFGERERARVTLDCIADGVASTDTAGNITFLNLAAETMSGFSSKQAAGLPMGEVFCVAAAANVQIGADAASIETGPGQRDSSVLESDTVPLVHAVCRGEAVSLATDVFRRADGSTYAAEYSSAPLRDPKGTLVGAVIAIRDITERRAIERLKDEFVSTVSHELRTPLTSIRGALGLLNSGMLGAVAEKGQRMLGIAVTNTDRLIRLINDILDLERIDSGQIELVRSVIDAQSLMARAIEGVQTMADGARVELALVACDAQLHIDTDRITQALTNLLGNAIKFSPPGTCVTLSGEASGGMLTIRVADRGRGIPADKVKLVFERFKQVDASDSRDKGGSGLGLAICSSIIKAHGGRIWTENNGEQGSVFLFTVPLHTPSPEVPLPAVMSDDAPAAATVLIVEDDEDLSRVMSAALHENGIRTVRAATGKEGIAIALRHRPDLVVLDLALQDMDGYEVVGTLRRQSALKEVPLLIYSALEVGAADRQLLMLGPTAFLTKSKASLGTFEAGVKSLLARGPAAETVTPHPPVTDGRAARSPS